MLTGVFHVPFEVIIFSPKGTLFEPKKLNKYYNLFNNCRSQHDTIFKAVNINAKKVKLSQFRVNYLNSISNISLFIITDWQLRIKEEDNIRRANIVSTCRLYRLK